MDVHIVQRGDTLWKISRQYGISFEDLKRVNAHLANPDYVVPGMKIFLPEKKQQVEGSKQTSTNKGQQVEKAKQVEKKEPEVVKGAVKPKEEIKAPIPLPSVQKSPTITSKPVDQPKPPKTELPKEQPVSPTRPKPEQTWQVPQPPPSGQQQPPQMAPVQPYPVMGIPCGWIPIYDADCYPYLHQRQIQPMPPMQQLPVQEHHEFRPSHPESRPIQREQKTLPKQEKDKMKPVPHQPKLQEPSLSVPKRVPDIDDSKDKKIPKVPQEQPTAPPTYEMPYPQHVQEPMPQPAWPYPMQQPYPMHAGQPSSCGCNQFEPVQAWPQPMHQMQPMHSQPHPFCQTCHQPMYYPTPNQWPGTYS